MRKLYQYPLCPLSRQARIYLKELGVEFTMIKQDYWQRNLEFSSLSPTAILPILQETSYTPIFGIYPITEYLYEKYQDFSFMDKTIEVKCEIRRLLSWFNEKFDREVTRILLDERIIRSYRQLGPPRTEYLRAAKNNMAQHIAYLSDLLHARSFIASDSLSSADIAAACHISVLDYLGEVNWDKYPPVKHWYSIIKSRPSFRPLLQDLLPGFAPPSYYSDLDF